MENASKALIIAGAILLAIVIISLGLVVINNSRHVTDDPNLNEQEKQSFNAKFAAYEGKNISGSRINSLIQQVIATNQASVKASESQFITIAFPSITSTDENQAIYITTANDGTMKYITGNINKLKIEDPKIAAIKGDDKDIKLSAADVGNPALSVNTGKNYTVKLYYKNGLVKFIAVY